MYISNAKNNNYKLLFLFRYQHEVERIKEAVRQRNLARRGLQAPQIGKLEFLKYKNTITINYFSKTNPPRTSTCCARASNKRRRWRWCNGSLNLKLFLYICCVVTLSTLVSVTTDYSMIDFPQTRANYHCTFI
jgi:hypothetical protein